MDSQSSQPLLCVFVSSLPLRCEFMRLVCPLHLIPTFLSSHWIYYCLERLLTYLKSCVIHWGTDCRVRSSPKVKGIKFNAWNLWLSQMCFGFFLWFLNDFQKVRGGIVLLLLSGHYTKLLWHFRLLLSLVIVVHFLTLSYCKCCHNMYK